MAGGGAFHAMTSNDFEQSRQARETRNERLICWFAGGMLLAVVLAHLVLRLATTLQPQPPWLLIGFELAGVGIMSGILLVLHRSSGYRWWRKYLLSAWTVALAVGVNLAARLAGDPVLSLFLSIPIYMLVVLLSGLRYSIGAVLFTTALALLAHLAFMLQATLPVRFLAFAAGWVAIGGVGITVSHLVRSMLQLHRDSVSKERLRRFLAPEVVQEIMAAPALGRGAVEAEVTVLFADISDFTGLAARLSPQQVIDLLNDYFPAMASIVFRHHGTLEKYIGDALLAVWGAPLWRKDDAARAVRAAQEMQQAMHTLNLRWNARGGPTLQIHIGLHTGRVAAGHIGTDEYLQYATIGDTTNLASRICAVAGPDEIVVSGTTRAQLGEDGLSFLALPPVQVKGVAAALRLYRLVVGLDSRQPGQRSHAHAGETRLADG